MVKLLPEVQKHRLWNVVDTQIIKLKETLTYWKLLMVVAVKTDMSSLVEVT